MASRYKFYELRRDIYKLLRSKAMLYQSLTLASLDGISNNSLARAQTFQDICDMIGLQTSPASARQAALAIFSKWEHTATIALLVNIKGAQNERRPVEKVRLKKVVSDWGSMLGRSLLSQSPGPHSAQDYEPSQRLLNIDHRLVSSTSQAISNVSGVDGAADRTYIDNDEFRALLTLALTRAEIGEVESSEERTAVETLANLKDEMALEALLNDSILQSAPCHNAAVSRSSKRRRLLEEEAVHAGKELDEIKGKYVLAQERVKRLRALIALEDD